jgi:hypothetical protein
LPGPPAEAWVGWLVGPAGGAGGATLAAAAGASFVAGAVVWFGRGRVGPFGGDDRLEFGPQQLLIGAEQLQELLVGARRRSPAVGVLEHHSHPRAQALIACRSSLLLVMAILRGLACSATGICRVSTPLS